MSAELLRRAAALMRERATAATAGPWRAGDRCVWSEGIDASEMDDTIVSDGPGGHGGVIDPPDATHIASWYPAVALAVADWLSGVASLESHDRADKNEVLAALAVARAYLGSDA